MTEAKILYHHRTQGKGAEGLHIKYVVNEFRKKGRQVDILSPAGTDPFNQKGSTIPTDKSKVCAKGVGILWKLISKWLPGILFEMLELFYNVYAGQKLTTKLNNNNYNVIYERYAFFLFVTAYVAKKRNIFFILEVNETSGVEDRARKQILKSLCLRIEKYIFKKADLIVTVSNYLKTEIEERGAISSKILMLPNAVADNLVNYNNNTEWINSAREKYKLTGCTVLGFVGWFDYWDRIDILVDTFREIRKENNNIRLLLVGDGPVLDEIFEDRNTLADEGIVLTGAVERNEVYDYISLLDIAVLSHSNKFGSPVVLFEFMALGIPIVASGVGPIKDVLVDGESAMIFDVLDKESMKNKLIEIINDKDKRKKLSEAAYSNLIHLHTWERNVTKLIEYMRKKCK